MKRKILIVLGLSFGLVTSTWAQEVSPQHPSQLKGQSSLAANDIKTFPPVQCEQGHCTRVPVVKCEHGHCTKVYIKDYRMPGMQTAQLAVK
jgi:hypothetical protein